MINGIAAPIYFVSPGQMSVIVPYGVTGAVAKIQVINNNVASNTVTTFVSQTAPGMLTQSRMAGLRGRASTWMARLVTAENPAQIGETVSVFVTGLGAVDPAISDGAAGPTDPLRCRPATITAYVGGVKATVGYAGLAPQLAGLYQINLTVPAWRHRGRQLLDIAGPDAYSSEVPIAVAGAPAAASAPQPAACRFRGRPHALTAPPVLKSQRLDDAVDIGVAHAASSLHQSRARTLVEGLEERHLGDRVAFGGGELARVGLFPGAQRRFADQHLRGMPGLAVGARR